MTAKNTAKKIEKLHAKAEKLDLQDAKAKANKLGKKLLSFAEHKGEDFAKASEKAATALWSEVKAKPSRSALLLLAGGYLATVIVSALRSDK